MIKTKLFIESDRHPFKSIEKYQKFIEDNPHIQIISVNTFDGNYVLLTYK